MLELDIFHHQGDFTLELAGRTDARVLGVFGPSGSGKTTLLNCLAGMTTPQKARTRLGSTTIADRDSNKGISLPPHRRGIACVFQDLLLFPHMTVAQNLKYGQSAFGPGPGFDEVVDILQVRSLLDRPAGMISGGEARRVAMGRAVLTGPKLLLLDEPLAGLDRRLAGQTLHFLKRLLQRFEMRAVYVSHGIGDTMLICDEVWALDAGRLVGQGHPREVLCRPNIMPSSHTAELDNLFFAQRAVNTESDARSTSRTYTVGDQPLVVASPSLVAFDPQKSPPGESRQAFTDSTDLLSVRAADIILAAEKPQAISARNLLRARVISLQPLDRQVLVGIDVGVPWMATLTPSAVSELGLAPQKEIFAIVKATAVAVLSAEFTTKKTNLS